MSARESLPGGSILALPAAWTFVRDVLREAAGTRHALNIAGGQ
jgi:hypothetical protein